MLMNTIIIILLITIQFSLYSFIQSNNVIKLRLFYNSGLDSIYFKGKIGTPFDEIYYGLDLSSSNSFILKSNDNYNKSLSSSYRFVSNDTKSSMEQIKFEETIGFDNITLTNFPFTQIDSPNIYIYVPYIGFGKGNESMIEILYQLRFITQKTLKWRYNTLIIGESNIDNQAHCELNDAVSYYACHIDKVILRKEDDSKEIVMQNSNVILSSTFEDIIFPIESYDIIDAMFEISDARKCYSNVSRENRIHYTCNDKLINDSLSIHFQFPHFTMKLDHKHMFLKDSFYSVNSRFIIAFANNTTDITFGFSILKLFSIEISQDENKVFFYSIDDLLSKNPNSNQHTFPTNVIIFCRLLIIINIIGLIYSIYSKVFIFTKL